jgi:hypothetical protein
VLLPLESTTLNGRELEGDLAKVVVKIEMTEYVQKKSNDMT